MIKISKNNKNFLTKNNFRLLTTLTSKNTDASEETTNIFVYVNTKNPPLEKNQEQ
jgi:hypothetical protein